jgi:hypothetical protein
LRINRCIIIIAIAVSSHITRWRTRITDNRYIRIAPSIIIQILIKRRLDIIACKRMRCKDRPIAICVSNPNRNFMLPLRQPTNIQLQN